jgi:hypothetical protein
LEKSLGQKVSVSEFLEDFRELVGFGGDLDEKAFLGGKVARHLGHGLMEGEAESQEAGEVVGYGHLVFSGRKKGFAEGG